MRGASQRYTQCRSSAASEEYKGQRLEYKEWGNKQFSDRIRQEIKRNKYFHYLDIKRKCKLHGKTNKEINKILIAEISKVAKKNGLHGFEIPRAVHLDAEQFSIENGLLTPTFKLKRQHARNKYEPQIEGMYAIMPKPRRKI